MPRWFATFVFLIGCDAFTSAPLVESPDSGAPPSDSGTQNPSTDAGDTGAPLATPISVTTDAPPSGVWADATHVYWTENNPGHIHRAKLTDITVVEDVTLTAGAPRNIVGVSAERLAYTNATGVQLIRKNGGATSSEAALDSAGALVWDGLAVWVVTNQAVTGYPIAGTSFGTAQPTLGGTLNLDVAAHGGAIVYADSSEGVIRVIGGTPLEGELGVLSIASDAAGHFWSREGGLIRRWSGSGPPSDVATNEKTAYSLAADGTALYWLAVEVGTNTAKLRRKVHRASIVETLAEIASLTFEPREQLLHVTPTHVVWSSTNAIHFIAKTSLP